MNPARGSCQGPLQAVRAGFLLENATINALGVGHMPMDIFATLLCLHLLCIFARTCTLRNMNYELAGITGESAA